MSTTITIYDGDDQARLVRLRTEAAVAESRYDDAVSRPGPAPLRAGDAVETMPLREAWEAAERAFDEFVDEAAARATEIEVHHLGRRRFRSLRLAHPPRTRQVERDGAVVTEPIPEDAPYGFNIETFPMALLTYVDDVDTKVRTIVKPRKTPAKLSAWLDDELSEGQFDEIWTAAYRENTGGVGPDPRLLKFSGAPPISEETSA